MTRPYALKKLLEHGPLTWVQMLEITGWSKRQLGSTLQRMSKRGEVQPVGREWNRKLWGLV